ncbi:hypothetical protein D3C79_1074450 [compost metagenome]
MCSTLTQQPLIGRLVQRKAWGAYQPLLGESRLTQQALQRTNMHLLGPVRSGHDGDLLVR